MRRIRVLVVDDSRFMVTLITSILQAAGDIEVVGHALDGEEAVAKAHELQPHAITMDVVMPRMDGLQATRRIVAELGIPIIILSAYTQQGAALTVEALRAGAVECIAKPSGERSLSLDAIAQTLVAKVRGVVSAVRTDGPGAVTATGLPVFTAAAAGAPTVPMMPALRVRPGAVKPAVVAIGASTGGIQALCDLLPRFDARIPFGILVVQHFPEGFTASLAEKLASISTVRVAEAQPGQFLTPGTALVAPGGKNMEVTAGLRIRIFEDASPDVMRPSVDATFRSVARVYGPAGVAVVLTGMGRDGADGAREVAAAGGRVIVQDWRHATAWGMPRAAYETGVAEVLLPLERIASYLVQMGR